ncbi:MAG TPA: 50S ribosomal protein L33 [Tetragenococcus sp.]|nr:50S ribosomal protein L33 [Tetragenococcus sp.]
MNNKKVALACSECGSRNYTLPVSKNKGDQRLELKKFCKYCNKHTIHRQTK